MIKNIFIICIIGILFMISGCSKYSIPQAGQNVSDVGYNNETNKKPIPNYQRPASIGGVCLGDSSEKVAEILGKEYKESLEIDESGYIGEDMIVWSFDSGIDITFGKGSGKVIRVASHSSDFQTDLGIKVGDKAEITLQKYNKKFTGVKSRHSEEVLPGWYDIGDGKIMIFHYNEDENTVVSSNVNPNSDIQEIVLAYWEHFD